jgi:hypothetical protein
MSNEAQNKKDDERKDRSVPYLTIEAQLRSLVSSSWVRSSCYQLYQFFGQLIKLVGQNKLRAELEIFIAYIVRRNLIVFF